MLELLQLPCLGKAKTVACTMLPLGCNVRAQNGHVDIRILQTMISEDPCVYGVFGAPKHGSSWLQDAAVFVTVSGRCRHSRL